jgi:hypothetical protein
MEQNEIGGAYSMYGERRDVYPGLWWENLRGKRTFGRPSRRWEDNIKIDLQELVYGGVDWIDLA